MSKNDPLSTFMLAQVWACVPRHVLMRAAYTHAHAGMFLRVRICSSVHAHVGFTLRTHAAWQKPYFEHLNSFSIYSLSICNFNIIPHYICI